MVKLEDVCEILDNQRIPITKANRVKGIYPYYGANGIQDYVDDYIFDDDLVLLAEDGGNFGSKDKPIAYKVSGKCWVNNHAHVLKPKDNINIDYLCYSLMFYDTNGLVNGATRQKLTQSTMRKMSIIYRDMDEQIKIVNKISHVSELIDNSKKQLSKLDELVKARFVEMFGDPTINDKRWGNKELKQISKLMSGGTPTRQCPEYFEGTIPWITTVSLGKITIDENDAVEFITKEAIENSATKLIPENSLLFGIRVGVGKVSKNIVPMCTNQDIVAITNIDSNLINIVFFKHLLDSFAKYFETQKRGATIQGIKSDVLKTLKVILPPIELQNKFAEFVEQVEKSKQEIQQSIEKLETLKKSLMQEYFG